MITFISGTICYFMVGLHPGFEHYLFFVLCLYASVTVVESLMMAIASIVPNFLMGIIIGAGIQVCWWSSNLLCCSSWKSSFLNVQSVHVIFPTFQGIFMLVSGYFRLPNDIPKPVWRYPMSYLSFHFWALQVINPFLSLHCTCSCYCVSSIIEMAYVFFRGNIRMIWEAYGSTTRHQIFPRFLVSTYWKMYSR